MTDYGGQTKTLDEAYVYLDPLFALKKGGADQKYWDWFYVERDSQILSSLVRSIRYHKRPRLYSGHIGSGKSTELQRLAHNPDLQREFVVIHYSVKEDLDPANLDFADVLVSIAAKLFLAGDAAGVPLSNELLTKIREWKEAVIEHSDTLLGTFELKLQTDVKAFFLQWLGVLKGSREMKETYAAKVKQRIQGLIDIINDRLILEIHASHQLGKMPLVILDDLEKLSLEQARAIFKDHGKLLSELRCPIIYTFPIALEYDLDMNPVIGLFGEVIRLPNMKLRTKDGQPVAENLAWMREVVERRMSLKLIDEIALNKAIEYSGGVVRELFRILSIACDQALNQDMPAIGVPQVQSAINRIQNHYVYSLKDELHYPLLAKVYETKAVEGDQQYVRLMHSLHILKYANDVDWFDINPMIRDQVQKRTRTINAASFG